MHHKSVSGHSIFNPTDNGNALRFAKKYKGSAVYVCEAKKWYIYNGHKWEQDTTGQVVRWAKQVIMDLHKEAEGIKNDRERAELIKHALKSESNARLKAMLALAETELYAKMDEFNKDQFLLNCTNGTLNLKTGELRPHNAEDMISKVTNCEYDPDAQSDLFDNFLKQILPDQEKRRFIQQCAGYTATGSAIEEILLFLCGPPGTGKSTLLAAIYSALGDYSTVLDFESLIKRDRATGAPRNDLARLHGKRFVQSVEVDDGRYLAEALVNQITGGDTITARYLHCEYFDFLPTFTLWLAANNKPIVSNPESGIWRRIKMIAFDEVVPESGKDPELKTKLKDHHGAGKAVLKWLVDGCKMWQESGLQVPESVIVETNDYKEESDPLNDFFEERCILGDMQRCENTELYNEYIDYCNKNAIRLPLAQKKFTQTMQKKGFSQIKSGKRYWIGISIPAHKAKSYTS